MFCDFKYFKKAEHDANNKTSYGWEGSKYTPAVAMFHFHTMSNFVRMKRIVSETRDEG